MTKNKFDRRDFISRAAFGTIGTLGAAGLISSCSRNNNKKELPLPVILDIAPDGPILKAGLIGCGGRGRGAAVNFLDAGPNLQITALGDIFQDKLNECRAELKEKKNVEIADEKCFVGFDAYQKVIDSGVDIVLLCTPPHFRPQHTEAAVNARKHIFMEKPCAVDPVGVRRVMVAAQKADSLGLCIVTGTVRRAQKDYMETWRRVQNGEIGEIVSAHVIRNGGSLWAMQRRPEWSDLEYMARNWGNFAWLSGDHIVEQFIHEIDVMNWHLGINPVRATGWGGRQKRITGDQYDFFSIEYVYENGMRTHCAARQISGCSSEKKEIIVGTKGYADASGIIYDHKGEQLWKYPMPDKESTDKTWAVKNPFDQEHINLVAAIRTNQVVNQAEAQANSTLLAIMGRISAYTGKNVTWEEMLNSDIYLGPKVYDFNQKYEVIEAVPVVGA